MHCRRYHNIHCLWNSRFVPCAFDCDAERGLLLHTPTFSAHPGADGLETFFLFFYSSLLFQGWRLEMLSAKSKAIPYWWQRRLAVADRKKVDFEVTLFPWLSSKILLIRHKKAAYTQGCSLLRKKTHLKCFIVGVEERRRWREGKYMETFHILVEVGPNYRGGWSCNYTDWTRRTEAATFSSYCGSGQWTYIYGSWATVNMPVASVAVCLCGSCCYFQQHWPYYTH